MHRKERTVWLREIGWRLAEALRWIGMAFILFGLFFGLGTIFKNVAIMALGWSLVGVGLGFIALFLQHKSDKRMRAMVKVQFDEKMGVIEFHLNRISAREKLLPELIYRDVKACVEL